jgi:hypothetical protein
MSNSDPMPVFTIKARDALAVPTLRAYEEECLLHGLDDQAFQVRQARVEISLWQQRNINETKLPDHVHKPAEGEHEQPDS